MQEIISRFSKKEKMFLYAAVIFVMAALLDRAVLHPIIERITQFEEDIKKTEYEMTKNIKIIQQRPRIEKEEKKYATYAGEPRTEEQETASLLREIENIAGDIGVYLLDLKPAGVETEGLVKKFKVSLSCEGDMDQIISFLYSVENAESLMYVGAFAFGPKGKQTDLAQCEVLIYKVIIP